MPCGGSRSGLAGLWAIGGKLVQGEESAPNRISGQTRCPDCGWRIAGDFDWCPQCGLRLKPYQCDYCQGTILQDIQECPRCGAPAN